MIHIPYILGEEINMSMPRPTTNGRLGLLISKKVRHDVWHATQRSIGGSNVAVFRANDKWYPTVSTAGIRHAEQRFLEDRLGEVLKQGTGRIRDFFVYTERRPCGAVSPRGSGSCPPPNCQATLEALSTVAFALGPGTRWHHETGVAYSHPYGMLGAGEEHSQGAAEFSNRVRSEPPMKFPLWLGKMMEPIDYIA